MEIYQKQIQALKLEQEEMRKLLAQLVSLVGLKANQKEVDSIQTNITKLHAHIKEISGALYEIEIEHNKNMGELRNIGNSIENQIARANRVRQSRPYGLNLGY